MKIKLLYTNAESIYEKMNGSAQFAQIFYSHDFREAIISEAMEGHTILWLDLEKDIANSKEVLKDLNEPEFKALENNITLYVVMPSSFVGAPHLEQESEIATMADMPYRNIDLMKIVNELKLPWQAIYSEYFWTSIAANGSIALFENKRYILSDEDVALFILGSRYFGKIKNVFKFDFEENKKLSDTFKTITLALHGVENPKKLPISNVRELVSNYNLAVNFNQDKIVSYLGDEEGNFKIVIAKINELALKISAALKVLNFDYWLKAIIGRLVIERNKNNFIAKYSDEIYAADYHVFSGLEHSTDFVFVSLFTLVDKNGFDGAFTRAQEFMDLH